MKRFVCAILAVFAVASCSPASDIPLAKQEVAAFRKQWAAGQCTEIHAGASREFSEAIAREQWMQMCRLLAVKLGAFQSAGEPGWTDNVYNGSHFVVLTYESKFAKGPGQEEFVYRLDGGKALLAGYHVNSALLLEPSPETLERGEKLGVAINNGVGS